MEQLVTTTTTADHDVLIELNTNVKNLSITLQSYIAATSTQITDHETRLRDLEKDNSEHAGSIKSQKFSMQVISVVFTVVATVIAIIAIVWK